MASTIISIIKAIAIIISGIPALVKLAKDLFIELNKYLIQLATKKKRKEINDAFKNAEETGNSDNIENILPRSDK